MSIEILILYITEQTPKLNTLEPQIRALMQNIEKIMMHISFPSN